jgi:hypothetical protein
MVPQIHFADYSGFDGNRVIVDPDRLFHDIINNKISRNARK